MTASEKTISSILKDLTNVHENLLFYHFIKKTSTVFNNDYYYFKSAYIEPFYFPEVSEDNKKYISDIVKTIIAMHKKDNSNTDELESKINKKVFEIYGLTPEEIAIVEGK